MSRPRVEELVQKLAHGASNILGLGRHVRRQERNQTGAVRVGDDEAYRYGASSGHDLPINTDGGRT